MAFRRVRTAAALLLAACAAIVIAEPAHANLDQVQCVGTESESYSPGLLVAPRTTTVTLDRDLTTCVSLLHPGLTSDYHAIFPGLTKSCSDLLESGTFSIVIPWNTGQTSTFSYTRSTSTPGGVTVFTRTGTITAGLFAGRSAIMVTTMAPSDAGACLAEPGLASASGAVTFTVFPV